ncbi:MAG: T9SS type A sorting domain-containing protein [Bacteroidetes bacterium]|nr:T9SS type A sorting domain-containing protein [Bacteroidota bacterium]
MKKLIFIIAVVAMCFLSLRPQTAKANNFAGGEIFYEWISDSTYRFFVVVYRDCAGSTLPSTMPLCFKNPCNASQNFSATMALWTGSIPGGGTNGGTMPVGCSQYKTNCDSPASALQGFQRTWYYANVTLPSRCNAWRAFTYASNRSVSANLLNSTSKPFYLECRFNNVGTFQGNSSPYFSISGAVYAPTIQPFSYNAGAIDPNGDSIVTEVINPMTDVTACSDTGGVNIGFVTVSPALSIPANPFQTNNTFTINSATGNTTFTANIVGKHVYTIRVKEYRGGVLVGSVMRDVITNVMSYSATAPIYTLNTAAITGGTWDGNKINGCTNQTIGFNFYVKSADPSAILVLSDNHTFTLPSATVTYNNQRKDSVRGFVTVFPSINDTGTKNIIITTKDSTCKPPGLQLYYTFSIPIKIWARTRAVDDTAICLGASALLNINTGGGNYTWSVLSGGSPVTTLSCTTCVAPLASPTNTTRYVVTSSATNSICPNQSKDTVQVTVNPAYPPTIGSNDTAICYGEWLQLNVTNGVSPVWSVAQGSKYSLSCTPCVNPIARPNTTTKYVVTSITNYCKNNIDTVTVRVIPIKTEVPLVSIYASPGTELLKGMNVTFRSIVRRCDSSTIQWYVNGIYLAGASYDTLSIPAFVSDGDVISCYLTCYDPCAKVTTVQSNKLRMSIAVLTGVGEIEQNQIKIYPNPNNGTFNINAHVNNNGILPLEILNTLGQVVYLDKISVTNNEVNQQVKLELPDGMYIIKLDGYMYKFSVAH